MDKGDLYSEIMIIQRKINKLSKSKGLDEFEEEYINRIKELLDELIRSYT